MKIKTWVIFLLAALLGLAAGFLVPQSDPFFSNAITWLEKFAIRIGHYAAVPLLVFSLSIAVYELWQDGRFWGLLIRSLLVMAVSAVFVIGAGVFFTLFFSPARIQIVNGEQPAAAFIDISGAILELFPSNMFTALVSDGIYLLPACFFAFFLGVGLSYDRNHAKAVTNLIDSLSRVFYKVAAFFSHILAVFLIALGAYWAFHFRQVLETGMFRDLIILLGILSGVLGFIILPLFLYFLKPKVNPWAMLYGSLAPALAAFFSGDVNFTLPVLMRHVKENLGARRRANAITLSLFTIFGRAGSAMVAVIAFIVIINSYSSLGIPVQDVMGIGIQACVISCLLVRHPGDGAYTALALLCQNYGQGFEAGYLNLQPLAFYLVAVGAFLDVMIAAFASCVISRTTGFWEEKSPRHFI